MNHNDGLPSPVDTGRFAVFGGIYNNHLSLRATLDDARRRGAGALFCLGDMGGFGPHPDRVFGPLRDSDDVFVMQGNYDHSVGNRLDDCACGYTDPRDNKFAQISYDYTLRNTSDVHKDWMRDLPTEFQCRWADRSVLMAHGSPRRVNEFLWESTCSDVFLEYLLEEHDADVLFVTHTGIPWKRRLESGRLVVNVGAIGRPANNGGTSVDYAMVDVDASGVDVSFVEVDYDYRQLAEQMRAEDLPDEFVETITTGWWTTCLEILPAMERSRGKY